jgi:hypothetical protein
MNKYGKLPLIIKLYFGVSSISLGSIEFIHDWKRYAKIKPDNKINNTIRSIPGFLSGVVLGPALPFFYFAGCKSLDYKRCPQLK